MQESLGTPAQETPRHYPPPATAIVSPLLRRRSSHSLATLFEIAGASPHIFALDFYIAAGQRPAADIHARPLDLLWRHIMPDWAAYKRRERAHSKGDHSECSHKCPAARQAFIDNDKRATLKAYNDLIGIPDDWDGEVDRLNIL